MGKTHSKNKRHITAHNTPIIIPRVLSESDPYMLNYDNDAEMKSVKENFDRQTSQRFDEYEERMKVKRQKRKEERDKNIQEIIEKDRMNKSLSEKLEKGCLRCGCGLGGVAASVGIFGAIAVNEWTKAATAAAVQKGIDEGIKVAIKELGNIVRLNEFKLIDWAANINGTNFLKQNELISIVNQVNNMCTESEAAGETAFCMATKAWSEKSSMLDVQVISQEAAKAAGVADKAAKSIEEAEIALANAESTYMYSAIGYSVLGILIILLAMLIIYLILRYRRKKRMNKKLQYTKLLNQ
ncbi:rifin [Plasmodium falciparum IGH-CR14]|uniref:Rifin n=1 Tax=Plasmodium falciparum IGH-CR14 TaxID=580059 RepID=A0A0L1I5N0_PLAFA|nr:rifin [Plasmodium falciparum IGH-CR14]